MIRTLNSSAIIPTMEKLNRAQTIFLALTMAGHTHLTMYLGKYHIVVTAYCDNGEECDKVEQIVKQYTRENDKVKFDCLDNDGNPFYTIQVETSLGERFENE